MAIPQQEFPPVPHRSPSTAAVRLVVALVLALLLLAYLLAVFLTRDIWAERDGTQVTFAARMLDGSTPSPDVVAQVPAIIEERLDGLGLSGAEAAADDTSVTVTVPGHDLDVDAVGVLFRTGQLYVRPVIHAMPVQTPSAPPPAASQGPPPSDQNQRIADEKQLRQSTDASIQILALQFQATRCGEDDVLAGYDDPKLPLVTCSADGSTVYLLNKSILSGAQIRDASSDRESQGDRYVVDLQFDDDAARTWANFTAANIGTQTAFSLDTKVAAAPEIREAIPDGRTQISGTFDADSAREMASMLASGSLPVSLAYESSRSEKLPATTISIVLRVLVIAAGIGLALLVLGAVVYLTRRGSDPARAVVDPPKF
ncbi:preprotein translocase subunit SecD [Mycolicibacterium sp. XJ870]